ncbi:sulfatase-like hydrolase/transferase [Maricurvus nonylphenolicus]|uniref:sulfatase family protein n=1 Tax=Maricurvus nonylphenolicus TaxID=1008307 RepID=UPI0036F23C92
MVKVVIAIALASFSIAAFASESRPNILLLMAEDMSARVGSFGDSVAVTPHLDQLAKEGVRFPNTFTTAGVCSPSRAALMMGTHQTAFGAQHMRSNNAPEGGYKPVPPADMKAFPELLRAAGYRTYTTGKLDYQFSGMTLGSGPFTIWDREEQDAHWRDFNGDKPFFGFVNLLETHESGVFSPLGTMPNSAVHLMTQLGRAWFVGIPPKHFPVKPEQIKLEPYYPDTKAVREDIARHYNNVTLMDTKVGQLLQELEADGILENTIVIWTTDHGDGLPRAKRELFDSGIKVPMIIRWPERYKPASAAAGSIEKRLISFVDLGPTILKLAGVTVPASMTGQDFRDDAQSRQYVYATRDRIDEVRDRQRAVRDQRFKYIYSYQPQQPGGHKLNYRDNLDMMQDMHELFAAGKLNDLQQQWFQAPGKERLFDIQNDPHELNDLAKDPSYKEDLERMRQALSDWQGQVKDLGEMPEADMRAAFLKDDKQLETPVPQVRVDAGILTLTSVENASIGYRLNKGEWQLYKEPLNLDQHTKRVDAKAIRYGWKESDSVSWTP